MHLELSNEAILTQLGYRVNEQNLKQIETILKNTQGLQKFLPHLPSFSDALAIEKAFISMSNSHPYLKIKCEEDRSSNNLANFLELLEHWATKYKLKLQKVENKETYYIIGHI